MDLSFTLVDVFGKTPMAGNPLAVVHNADGLSTAEMMRITQWLNFSESTFLVAATDPAADYSVRIFTLDRELPFAGHPTLGTCAAWLHRGGQPRDAERITQQCGAGLIPLRRIAGQLAFAAPSLLRSGPPSDQEVATAAEILRIPRSEIMAAEWIDNGPGWLGIQLASADAVLRVSPVERWTTRAEIGIAGPHPPDSEVAFELRAFFTDQHGVMREDPVTGSLNASMAQWMIRTGRAPERYLMAQGTALDRAGRISIERDSSGQVWVAGATALLSTGTFHL